MTRFLLFSSLCLMMTTSVAALRAANNNQEVAAIVPSEAQIGEVLLSSARFLENKNNNQYT
jgi:hypothetical protein